MAYTIKAGGAAIEFSQIRTHEFSQISQMNYTMKAADAFPVRHVNLHRQAEL
jgi:hypothetical protein